MSADAFSKWCNDAGGIDGRTVVVDKLDAQAVQRRLRDPFRPAAATS